MPLNRILSFYFNSGKAFQYKGEWKLAADCYRKGLANSPDGNILYYYLGFCLYVSGNKDESVKFFKKSSGLDIPEGYASRSFISLYSGDVESASNYASKAIEKDKRFPDGYLLLGLISQTRGDRKKAEENYKIVLELDKYNYKAGKYLEELRGK